MHVNKTNMYVYHFLFVDRQFFVCFSKNIHL
jgi:hypothetical protein